MSSPTFPAQPPRTRRGMNDLPTEIKKYIVELAAEQDEVYREWITAVRPLLDDDPVAGVALDEQTGRYKSSIGALYGTSRLFSKLAAPVRFRVHKASRANMHFEMYVSRSQAQHFTEIHLDSEDVIRLRAVILATIRQSNVGKVVLQHRALRACGVAMDGAVSYSSGLSQYLQDSLRALAQQSCELHLHDFPDGDARRRIAEWGSLRSLKLQYNLAFVHTPFLSTLLAKTLGRLRELATLCVEVAPNVAFNLDPLLDAAGDVGAFSSVTSLSLSLPHLSADALAFASIFPHLNTLVLSAINSFLVDDSLSPSFTHLVFPKCRSLIVVGHYIQPTIDSISRSAFPRLASLELGPCDLETTAQQWIRTVLPEMGSQLSTLRLHERRPLLSDERSEVFAMVSASYPNLVVLDGPNLPVFPTAPMFLQLGDAFGKPSRAALASCRPKFVKSLAEFLATEVERDERDGDEGALAGLAMAGKALELERLARVG